MVTMWESTELLQLIWKSHVHYPPMQQAPSGIVLEDCPMHYITNMIADKNKYDQRI